MSIDILSLVHDTVVEYLEDRKTRHVNCGCASCQAQVNDIENWLSPQAFDGPVRTFREERQLESNLGLTTPQVWLCHSCLRKVSAPTGRCPYCGTERHVVK